MNIEWYALHSKPNKEELLWDQLNLHGVETYFPRVRVRAVNPRARQIRPYFPGYLFASVDFSLPQSSDLHWIPGLAAIVSYDGQPASVPEHIISAIRSHVDKLNAIKKETELNFKPGELVTVLGGPFEGYEAIFNEHISGTQRVHVLLKLLSDRRIQLNLPVKMVQPKQRSGMRSR